MSHESADNGSAHIALSAKYVTGKKPGEVVPSKSTDERVYNTSHARIGRAIILNQVEFDSKYLETRNGSKNDVLALGKLLTTWGFEFSSHDSLPVRRIRKLIEKAAVYDYSNTSCLMIFVLTHGDSKGKLHAKDGRFDVEDLYRPFLKNSSLNGKPKMFFLQACRGKFSDSGVIAKTTRENQLLDSIDCKVSHDECYTIPTHADMLIMYATIEGVVSFRNSSGSWFIQNLCEELSKNPHEDLLSILTYVNNRVAYDKQSTIPDSPEYNFSKQMPVVKHTLTKKLYLKKNSSNGEIADVKSSKTVQVSATEAAPGAIAKALACFKFWQCAKQSNVSDL